ncbi:type II toxin-antitoxin system PemK/MazF family toxin [Ligilactobacillus hohenheimensis]|uniref:type II toxin-antitoxin system PemK/MazF family toxin n=1 Tax=Ligilactobacillus hohenheimensis TaxID=2991832 RepID=UPI0038CBFA43
MIRSFLQTTIIVLNEHPWRNKRITKNYRQSDIVWINFSPSLGEEMRRPHPAVIIFSN